MTARADHYYPQPETFAHYVQKVPLAAVQKQVGHKSLQTTEIYLRLADEDVRKAYENVR